MLGTVRGVSSEPARDVVAQAQQMSDELLFPRSIETDLRGTVSRELLDALAGAGLYGLFADPADGGLGLERDAGEAVIEALASGCLTTTFVWVQHLSTAALVSRNEGAVHDEWARPLASGERRSGIAFSHLRHHGPPALTATPVPGGHRLDGVAPLVTGWGLVDVVHVATMLGQDVVWLLVDATEAVTLQARRLRLAAVDASATVALTFAGHVVPAERVTLVQPLEEWLDQDARGLRTNGSLALGVARRCLRLLGPSALDDVLDATRARLAAAGRDELPEARAAASFVALDAAAALVAAGGGRTMLRESHAQRLAREAVFLLVQGQTPAIRAAQLRRVTSRGLTGT